jgi:hypothetical protein
MKARSSWRGWLLLSCLFALLVISPTNAHADILWRNATSGDVAVWYMDGATIISGAYINTTPPPWKVDTFVPAVVSGTVRAPGGTVAFYPQPGLLERLAKIFSSSAYAALSGISNVADGMVVELVRIDDAGNTLSVVATTTVASGTYCFNLTNLHAGYSSNLIVQVRNRATGAKMRAFVTPGTANIDPVSEAVARAVLEKIAATPGLTLGAFTIKELSDLASSTDFLTTIKQATASANVDSTVTTIKNLLAADPGLSAFLTAAAAPGQTTEVPGDLGDYFPTAVGTMWRYNVVVQDTGASYTEYTDLFQVTGTKAVNGIQTIVFNETNPSNSGVASDRYLLKNAAGVTVYGDSDASSIDNQLSPYPLLTFPLRAGSSFVQADIARFDCGSDLDGDGIHETCAMRSVVTIIGLETVTVQAGLSQAASR